MPDLDEICKNFRSGFYDVDEVKEVSNKGENYAEENAGEGYTGDSMEAAAEYKRKYDEEQKKKAEELAKQQAVKEVQQALQTNPTPQSASANWIMPVNGKVSSPYGWCTHPITKVKTFHKGVDFEANTGDIIKAPMGGVQFSLPHIKDQMATVSE